MRYQKIVGMTLAAFALAACGSAGGAGDVGDAGQATELTTQTVKVSVKFDPDESVPAEDRAGQGYCPMTEAFAEVFGDSTKKLKVRVTNENDEVLATTFSDPKPLPSSAPAEAVGDFLESTCTLEMDLGDVPTGEEFYTFQADLDESNFGSKTGSITFSKAEMEMSGWTADLVISTTSG